MTETTQINKFRQKKLKSIAAKPHKKDDKSISSYFYPKNNLYTRQEFELLDTIYSDEPPSVIELKEENKIVENFWTQNKEEYLKLTKQKNSLFNNLSWFMGGVLLTSLVWFIYFQLSIIHIQDKHDTQIVFQKSAAIVTDKTVDEEVTKRLEDRKVQELQVTENAVVVKQAVPKNDKKFSLGNFFVGKKVIQLAAPLPKNVKQHMVVSGDSLWTIAQKYYLDPSPANIDRIMKSNNMKRIETLYIGQKIVVP